MKELRGRVAVVTGGASGIGFALAERFASEGMDVVVADVEAAALAGAAERLRAGGAEVLDVVTDVRDAQQVEALAERTVERFGDVHVVCNNAGVSVGGLAWEISAKEWEWVLDVNLWGVIHGVRSFVPRLLAAGEGHVVNTASMAGLRPLAVEPAYSVSKFGVVALSECVYAQLQTAGAPVGVSVLCPGAVRTHIGRSERNRPADVPPSSETATRFRRSMRQALEAGMSPSVVADKVVAAIREERFYVLPHDTEEWLTSLRVRSQDILERRNPTPQRPPGLDVALATGGEPRSG